jgi:hypothetical protein
VAGRLPYSRWQPALQGGKRDHVSISLTSLPDHDGHGRFECRLFRFRPPMSGIARRRALPRALVRHD